MNKLLCSAACSLTMAACDGPQEKEPTGGPDSSVQSDASADDEASADGGKDAGLDLEGDAGKVSCAEHALPVGERGPTELCTGRLAASAFGHALCSCTGMYLTSLKTDSFDSASGKMRTASGAAVGSNGDFIHLSPVEIGGSFTMSSTALTTSGTYPFVVRGDLRAPEIGLFGSLEVGRDLHVAGGLAAIGGGSIGRTLYQSPGHVQTGDIVAVQTVLQPVQISAPCACGTDSVFTTAEKDAVVIAAAKDNDNALLDFDLLELQEPTGILERDLPCGRFYLRKMDIGRAVSVTLHVTGKAALIVKSGVTGEGALIVSLAPNAEFDLFVGGEFSHTGPKRIGDSARPAATRIYTMSKGNISVKELSANLYAPLATVIAENSRLTVYGSIFARNIKAEDVTVHYDRAVLAKGSQCEEPDPVTCMHCGDCAAGKACIGGTCGACNTDSDCCAPLTCNEGTCRPL